MLQRVLACLVVMAMLLAPVTASLTHGPGAIAAALADRAVSQDHGHSHAAGTSVNIVHDASDHDHQPVALIPAGTSAVRVLPQRPAGWMSDPPDGKAPGPYIRPPRSKDA